MDNPLDIHKDGRTDGDRRSNASSLAATAINDAIYHLMDNSGNWSPIIGDERLHELYARWFGRAADRWMDW